MMQKLVGISDIKLKPLGKGRMNEEDDTSSDVFPPLLTSCCTAPTELRALE